VVRFWRGLGRRSRAVAPSRRSSCLQLLPDRKRHISAPISRKHKSTGNRDDALGRASPIRRAERACGAANARFIADGTIGVIWFSPHVDPAKANWLVTVSLRLTFVYRSATSDEYGSRKKK
jgi:hypothetical protein